MLRLRDRPMRRCLGALPAQASKTGKRARALAKCKAKATAGARRNCRAKAKKLPV